VQLTYSKTSQDGEYMITTTLENNEITKDAESAKLCPLAQVSNITTDHIMATSCGDILYTFHDIS
jgi:hypothetical protein